ncbi:hypothetical protein [Nonomuraea sp. NPDC050540]|uniref:hypothetical protein n=1 Tax=Nonomuraea sp. NPDC050540 TaxID=3364367 RepID=UPI0037AE58BA
MTKPTTHHITLDHDHDLHNVGNVGSPANVTVDPRGELTVNREVSDPARGHLPLTVWLAAADTETIATCRAGCCHPVSGPLARHLIAACTRMGETVIHLGAADHQVVSAALTAGCLPVAVFTDPGRAGVTWTRLARTHPAYDLEVTDLRVANPGVTGSGVPNPHEQEAPLLSDLATSAGLVVSEQVCDQPSHCPARPGSEDEAQVYDIASAAGLVKPGGHLAVVTGLHYGDGPGDRLPEIIAQACAAGLVYLQHIIALRHPARTDHIQPRHSFRGRTARKELPECAGLPASARAHSDVLLFARPRTSPLSPEPPVPTADALDEPTGSTSTTQIGGER